MWGSKCTLLCARETTCWKIKIKMGAEPFKSLEPQQEPLIVPFYSPGPMEHLGKRQ